MTEGGTHLQLQGVGTLLGTRSILHAIDLDIAPGEFVAIVGKSGCGKTTLLRVLAGLVPPSAGHVLVDGHLLQGLNPAARVMFQDARLLPWKRVVDNVGLG